jgi:hypothetical protein
VAFYVCKPSLAWKRARTDTSYWYPGPYRKEDVLRPAQFKSTRTVHRPGTNVSLCWEGKKLRVRIHRRGEVPETLQHNVASYSICSER